jgi:hypothetical protein
MTPLPPHIPGVVRTIPLDRLPEYYRLNNLEAVESNPSRTFPVIVGPPVPAGLTGEIMRAANDNKPAGILESAMPLNHELGGLPKE